jgi:uracil-DNA glycosylase
MPWLDSQMRVLRALGVHWATRVDAGEVLPGTSPALSAGLAQAAAVIGDEAGPAGPAPAPAGAVATLVPVSAGPAPAGLSGLGWDELRAAVAACEACGLCRTRTQTVFGTGSTQAQWMVVGEAPGEQEDLRGEPFVGAAGRLLDQMLAALGLRRDASAEGATQAAALPVYIANTLKCRPPGNRNPQPEELERCKAFLERQLDLLQPRIILAMGRFAVQSLLQSTEPVGKLRGRVHRYRGVPLVVTYHPAYLLRNPLDKARAWDDLCLAAATFEQSASGKAAP